MADRAYLGQSQQIAQEPSKIRTLADKLRGFGAGLAAMGGNYAPTRQIQEENQQMIDMSRRAALEQRLSEEWDLDKKIKQAQLSKLTSKSAGLLTPEERIKAEGSIRGELAPYTKQMNEVDSAYRKVQKAANNSSAAGDLSLIFGYMKMLDPSSTVREGEFANAQNAASIPDRVRNMYNKAMEGERLNDKQRLDFVSQADNVYNAQYESYNNMVQPYKGIAEQSGLNFENIALYKPTAKLKEVKDPSLVKQAGGALLDLAIPSAQAAPSRRRRYNPQTGNFEEVK